MAHYGKFVCSVIPVFNAVHENIARQLISTMQFTYPSHAVVVVGLRTISKDGNWVGDTSWSGIPQSVLNWGGIDITQDWEEYPEPKRLSQNAERVWVIRGTRLTIVEVKVVDIWDKRKKKLVPWKGRKTNVQRNVGIQIAFEAGAEVIALSDGKIRRPQHYLDVGLQMMDSQNVDSVAGQVKDLTEGKKNWINDLDSPKNVLFKRFPNFRRGYFLDRKKSGKVRTGPVFANVMTTKEALERIWEMLDEFATISYEDFMSWVRYLRNGGVFWVSGDPRFEVEHKHRSEWPQREREWWRAGAGAAQTFMRYPTEPFPRRRLWDVMIVLGAFLLAFILSAIPLIAGKPVYLLSGVLFALMLWALSGFFSMMQIKRWYGFFFPTVVGYLILVFTISFIREYTLHDGAQRLFQSMWTILLHMMVRSMS